MSDISQHHFVRESLWPQIGDAAHHHLHSHVSYCISHIFLSQFFLHKISELMATCGLRMRRHIIVEPIRVSEVSTCGFAAQEVVAQEFPQSLSVFPDQLSSFRCSILLHIAPRASVPRALTKALIPHWLP
jgi:hypothetical protein